MELTTLDTLDQAKALIDLVYSVYGLTFHRDFIYSPERLLELNRQGLVRSFLAIEGGTVLGHLGWIRPFFELTRDGEPLTDAGIGEVGLSIVRPDARGKHVQTGLAMKMAEWTSANGKNGAFMKCVTHHLFSQRTAANMGGKPLALFLAGVPKWVVYDRAAEPKEAPLSTLLYYVPITPHAPSTLRIPRHLGWIEDLIRASGAERNFVQGGPLDDGATDIEVEFQPSKRLAQVHVIHAGADLAEKIAATNKWLLEGHMEHISHFLPADSVHVQRQAMALEASAIFPAGWIPGLHRGARDVLVYCSIAAKELDTAAIVANDDDGANLRDRVVAAWRDVKAPAPSRRQRATGLPAGAAYRTRSG
jgi:hypothetical protein